MIDAAHPHNDSPTRSPQIGDIWWYHSIELPNGIVTPGEYDHRSIVSKIPLPPRLEGMRCLDVGTQDGFWAFEMERRGAKEVVAIDVIDPDDLDWPEPRPVLSDSTRDSVAVRKQGFELARQRLGSEVQRRDISVYNLDPDVVGTFDFAFLGTLLHHLRDPIGALQAVRRVVTGQFVVAALFSPLKTAMFPLTPVTEILEIGSDPFWEVPNVAGFRRQMEMGGWTIERWGPPHLQPNGAGWRNYPLSLTGRNWRTIPRQLLNRKGALHVSVVARPTVR